MTAATISSILRSLEQYHGEPSPPPASGPFEMVLWEIVAYLADDSVRLLAFQQLRERVGLDPARILAASQELLTVIARAGGSIAAEERAKRLQIASKFVVDDFGGDLSAVLRLPPQKAKKLLIRIPMIGEPGAEKILLFCGVLPVLALESNGVRVLVRLGVAEELKSYAATYTSAENSGTVAPGLRFTDESPFGPQAARATAVFPEWSSVSRLSRGKAMPLLREPRLKFYFC